VREYSAKQINNIQKYNSDTWTYIVQLCGVKRCRRRSIEKTQCSKKIRLLYSELSEKKNSTIQKDIGNYKNKDTQLITDQTGAIKE